MTLTKSARFSRERLWALLPLVLLGCGPTAASPGSPGSPGSSAATAQGVAVVCLDADAPPPADAAVCGRAVTFECGAPYPPIYVVAPSATTCAGAHLVASSAGFSLGANTVAVRDESPASAREVCSSTVTVVDRVAPAVEGAVIPLWPPNHQSQTFRAADCVTVRDACDAAPTAVFTWAQSDEPDDATGDGNTTGDISFVGCDAVSLRAERRGNGDGRVYSLGVRVTDRSGNVADAVCQVVVAHDQSGRPALAGPSASRVLAPADCR